MTDQDIDAMTSQQIVTLMGSTDKLGLAAKVFRAQMGALSQAEQRRRSIIDIRRMEFKAVLALAEVMGVKL